jgi:hypothetical protein
MGGPGRASAVLARDARAFGIGEAVHPLQGGLATRGFRQQAVPLPPVSEIPAGFDAIYQFRSDLLDEHLAGHVGQTIGVLASFFEVEADLLTAEIRAEIARRVLAATSASIFLDPTTGAGVARGATFDVERYALRVAVERPRILLLPVPVAYRLEPIEPGVRWTVRVDIGVPAPAPGPSTGVTVPPDTGVDVDLGLGAGSPGGAVATTPGGPTGGGSPGGATTGSTLRYVPLTGGSAVTAARLERGEHALRYSVWARLLLADSDAALESDDAVFRALLPHGLAPAIDEAMAPLASHPDAQVTPAMSIGGLLRRAEQLGDIQTFRASMVALPGHTAAFQVLALCLNLGPAAETGDPKLVGPFVGDRTYGYFASLKVIRSVLALRWARTDTPKTLVADVPVLLILEDGAEISATARARFTFLDRPTIDLAPGEWGVPDAIRLMGNYEIELLELRQAGEVVRGRQLGDLRGPEVHPCAIRIHPFEERTLPGGPGSAFLDDIGRRLMQPLYRPTAQSVRIRRLAGETSQAVGAFVLTADLG